jgi:putative intracellular protease/amidase
LAIIASKAFEITIAAGEPKVLSEQGVIIGSQVSWKEAHERLSDFDVLVIVGGNVEEIIKQKGEPLDLITAFSEVQKADPARERTLLSICTGSLLLAQQGILAGLSATTHPDFIIKFENLCSQAAVRDLGERTDVVEDTRYVVNNLRFELGDEDENPYIRRKSDAGRRPSNARYATPLFTLQKLYANIRRTERVPSPSRTQTPAASRLPAAPRCASVVFGSLRVGEWPPALMQPCILSASWSRRSRRMRLLASCSWSSRRALLLMELMSR